MNLRSTLTPDDIRHFIWDRAVEDNLVEFDLAYSDEEIKNAMEYAVFSYNDIAPIFITHNGTINNIPRKGFFIHGIIYHLYLSKMAKETRNDITYDAGGVKVDFNKTLIGHLQALVKFHKQEFEVGAKTFKVAANLQEGFDAFLG